jgi:hypothetical protein
MSTQTCPVCDGDMVGGRCSGHAVVIDARPMCDLCADGTRAIYDAASRQGPWGYMCQRHYDQFGVGLGTGRGQRLVVEGECAQLCGKQATVYAIDPHPGGWGGRYCEPCAKALRFKVTDRLVTP